MGFEPSCNNHKDKVSKNKVPIGRNTAVLFCVVENVADDIGSLLIIILKSAML